MLSTTKTSVRALLKIFTRTTLPGRYSVIEWLRPLIVENKSVIASTLKGVRFDLDLNDLIQRQIFFDLYDRSEVEYLYKLLSPGDIVLDIGGNIGYYGITLAKAVAPDGHVHIFEPISQNVEAIRRNVVLNGFQKSITVNGCAVTDSPGLLTLYGPEKADNTGWASVVPTKRKPLSVEVKAITIDEYVATENIQTIKLIKMDIEGAELKALHGMQKLLRREDAPIIYFEINTFLLNEQKISPSTLTDYLRSFRYDLFVHEDNDLIPLSTYYSKSEVYNILAKKAS